MSVRKKINLIQFSSSLKLKSANEQKQIFDPIRKKWFLLRPEEFVRQLAIVYMNEILSYPLKLIGVEKQLIVHGMKRRFDLVVFDRLASPYILVECKSPKEQLNENAALQIANYNIALTTQYLWLTNGDDNLFYKVDYVNKISKPVFSLPAFE